MSLEDQIRKLKKSGKLPCRTCGIQPDEKPEWKIHWGETGEPPREAYSEYCPDCGRLTSARIQLTWD